MKTSLQSRPTRRARVTNWVWLVYNAVSLFSVAAHSYQNGWEALGKVCGVVALVAAVVFVVMSLYRVKSYGSQEFLRGSFFFVVLGYIAGAVSFADGGLSLLTLFQPVLLSLFFVYNRRFLAWTKGC